MGKDSKWLQVLKVAFDEEVGSEKVELLRKLLPRLRYPATPCDLFAFHGQGIALLAPTSKDKAKNATLRFADGVSFSLSSIYFLLSYFFVSCFSLR